MKMEELKALRRLAADLYGKTGVSAEQLAILSRCVERLNAPDARLIRMRYVERLSWRQVAKRMGYSESRVYQLRRRVLRRLRAEKGLLQKDYS